MHRDLQQACAYGGYCNAQSFEELYQNFLASPWAYSQALRYRDMIHSAIATQNWGLIGLTPKFTQGIRPLVFAFSGREHAHVLDHAAPQRLDVVAAFERRDDASRAWRSATSTSCSVTQR